MWNFQSALNGTLAFTQSARFQRALWVIVLYAGSPMGLTSKTEGQIVKIIVRDITDAVVPAARARIISLDREVEAVADPEGEIKFTVVPGTYDIEISAKGFRDQTRRNLRLPTGNPESIDVVLHASDQPDHCGFVNTVEYKTAKPDLGALSGRVIDADSLRGIRRADVELLNVGTEAKYTSGLSDSNGNFAFAALPIGRYSVHASKAGYWPTELNQLVVPRENSVTVRLGLDKRGHMHVCQ